MIKTIKVTMKLAYYKRLGCCAQLINSQRTPQANRDKTLVRKDSGAQKTNMSLVLIIMPLSVDQLKFCSSVMTVSQKIVAEDFQ